MNNLLCKKNDFQVLNFRGMPIIHENSKTFAPQKLQVVGGHISLVTVKKL